MLAFLQSHNEIKLLPIKDTLRGYSLAAFKRDFRAGLEVALLAFPQGMAYAYIAGVPINYGIYGSAVATIVGVLFTSSRFIVLGPTNATAIMLLSSFVSMDIEGEAKLALIPMLLVMTGMMLLAGAYLRIAGLIQYVSRTVIIGYITAAALLIIVNQIQHIVGFQFEKRPTIFLEILTKSAVNLVNVHWPTLFLAALTAIFYWSFRNVRWMPNVALTMVSVSVISVLMQGPLVSWLHANDQVALAREIASVKMLVWRDSSEWFLPQLNFVDISRLAGTAQAIALLCVLEAISIGKSLAAKTGGRIDPNQEMFNMGVANVACGFFSGMAASGSLTRSSLCTTSGAATPMAGFYSGVLCLLAGFTLAPLVNYVPRAVLAVLVTIIGLSLINKYNILTSVKATKSDASVFICTLLASLLFPLDTAIYFGTVLAIVLFLRKVSNPILMEYKLGDDGHYTKLQDPAQRSNPKISIVHVEGQLFFAAAEIFNDQIRRVAEDPDLKVVILKIRHAQNLDATSIMALRELIVNMRDLGRHLLLCEVRAQAAGIIKRTGLRDFLGDENIFLDHEQNINLSTAQAVKRAKEILGEVNAEVKIFA